MIYKNVELVNHDSSVRANVIVENGKIKKIQKITPKAKPSKFIIPGFFDSHTHGGYGLDFNDFVYDVSREKIKKYFEGLYAEGVIAVAATTVTATKNELIKIATNFKKSLLKNKSIVAWYIEGPFISAEKKGAHDPKKIIPAEIKIIDTISKITPIKKIIAIAPEVTNNANKISALSKKNVIAIGHSDATADQTLAAMTQGASRIVHLYNQVSKFEHRTPGIVNAAFLDTPILCELICDGFHVNKITIKNTYDIVTPNRLIIISDSLSCKGQKNGTYNLGGLETTKTDEVVYIKNTKIIAGSIKSYDEQVRLFQSATHCSMQEIVKVTSYNAWKSIGKPNNGILKTNSPANFLLVDNNINILETIIDGKVVYKK